MSLLTLYPEQIRLLQDNNLQVIHLYGPPGTGKTVILVLKACQWLRQRKPVQVVSLSDESRCISYLIQRQLEHIHGSSSEIHLHVIKSPFNVFDIDKLASAATAGELFVIADEVIPVKGRSENPSSHEHTKFESFIIKLKKKVPTLHLWCASIRKLVNSPQDWMIQEELTTPLRSPPVVTREVSKSVGLTSTKTIPPYCIRFVPAATDGPAIKWLKHSKEPGHSNGQPMNCGACGEAIMELLLELGVGKEASAAASAVAAPTMVRAEVHASQHGDGRLVSLLHEPVRSKGMSSPQVTRFSGDGGVRSQERVATCVVKALLQFLANGIAPAQQLQGAL
ncbi:uncharacterized protein [Littorina saxatilis]|uniref:uncharacterized protein n=1 Tax=Littorina saxatilis TaxID=31220 RepID=UPI0038B4F345